MTRVAVIAGPTASGKTALAVALAARVGGEIVNADSQQVYRGLDVGTAKPTRRERALLPHHGLDLVAPGERYSAGRFARDAESWVADVRARGRMPVVVGGTGLYVRALSEGLFVEPPLDGWRRHALERWTAELEAHELVRWAARLDPGFHGGGRQRAARAVELALLTGHPLSHWQRIARQQAAVQPWYVRLTVPRQVLHQRIRRRALQMVQQGIIEEVAAALADGAEPGAAGLDGVGLKEAAAYLLQGGDRTQVAEAITISTRQYAKRQETWFRHQLPADTIVLEATRPPDELAAEIAARWRRHSDQKATPVP